VNTEERQLAELLHRVTPEPPRRVTVEDIAYRVASEGHGSGRGREPRARRGFSFGTRRWAPALAALGVIVIAGASAAIASVATSHHGQTPTANGTPTSSVSVSSPPASTASPSSTGPAGTPLRIAGGMWGAELISRQQLDQGSLTSSGDSLYAYRANSLARIDPATGNVVRATPYDMPVFSRPVILGDTVWLVWSYKGGDIVLRGYDAQTLAPVASIPVPAIGGVDDQALGVLAAGPDGKLYVAAGQTIAIVDPASRQVTHRIFMTAGRASTVAVSPDGSKLYVGINPGRSFQLLVYDVATGRVAASSRKPLDSAGALLATSGGVWGTAEAGASDYAWFAPGGDLDRSFRVGQGATSALDSMPVYSGGVVWVGGTRELICASPATGQAKASTAIPADQDAAEYFGSVTVLGSGRAYALYADLGSHHGGLATLTPPQACTG
jgi:outer membrane protein assembly factor BamB